MALRWPDSLLLQCLGLLMLLACRGADQLLVPVPDAVADLWPGGTPTVVAFAGDQAVHQAARYEAGGIRLTGELAAEIDRLLVQAWAHCRWARRGDDGAFRWDTSGWVLAGRLPDDLGPSWQGWPRPLGGFLDVLGPVGGTIPRELAEQFPWLSDGYTETEQFVIGVPGPGTWALVLYVGGGGHELLLTVEALREKDVPDALPVVASVRRGGRRIRFDVSALPAGDETTSTIEILAEVGWGGRSTVRWIDVDGAPRLEVPHHIEVSHRQTNLLGRTWYWRPGWTPQLVDGPALDPDGWVVERTVTPGDRSLLVRVADPDDVPLFEARVQLVDAEGHDVPAVWGRPDDPDRAGFAWGGSTDVAGMALAGDIPPLSSLRLRVRHDGHRERLVALPEASAPGEGGRRTGDPARPSVLDVILDPDHGG